MDQNGSYENTGQSICMCPNKYNENMKYWMKDALTLKHKRTCCLDRLQSLVFEIVFPNFKWMKIVWFSGPFRGNQLSPVPSCIHEKMLQSWCWKKKKKEKQKVSGTSVEHPHMCCVLIRTSHRAGMTPAWTPVRTALIKPPPFKSVQLFAINPKGKQKEKEMFSSNFFYTTEVLFCCFFSFLKKRKVLWRSPTLV